MATFEGEVLMRYPYVVISDDEEQAEFDMLCLAKDDFPEASGFSVVNTKEIKN